MSLDEGIHIYRNVANKKNLTAWKHKVLISSRCFWNHKKKTRLGFYYLKCSFFIGSELVRSAQSDVCRLFFMGCSVNWFTNYSRGLSHKHFILSEFSSMIFGFVINSLWTKNAICVYNRIPSSNCCIYMSLCVCMCLCVCVCVLFDVYYFM